MDFITFESGVTVTKPEERLAQFLGSEFAFYDAFEDNNPDSIVPLDVLAAVGINAFVGGAGAAKLRTIQQRLAKHCQPLLGAIPVSASIENEELDDLVTLLVEACNIDGVLAAVATKILHRKRRSLIPILDSIMIGQYCSSSDLRMLTETYVSDEKRADALRNALDAVRLDVVASHDELAELAQQVQSKGWSIGPLRVHDILVWTEVEPNGYYR